MRLRNKCTNELHSGHPTRSDGEVDLLVRPSVFGFTRLAIFDLRLLHLYISRKSKIYTNVSTYRLVRQHTSRDQTPKSKFENIVACTTLYVPRNRQQYLSALLAFPPLTRRIPASSISQNPPQYTNSYHLLPIPSPPSPSPSSSHLPTLPSTHKSPQSFQKASMSMGSGVLFLRCTITRDMSDM